MANKTTVPTIKASVLDQLMDESTMSNPTGYCTNCEELQFECAEPDAENYECEVCGERTFQGAMRIVEDSMFGTIRIVNDD